MTLAQLKQCGMQENGLNGQMDFVFLPNLEANAMASLIHVNLVAQFVEIAMAITPVLSSLAKPLPLVLNQLIVRYFCGISFG